MEYPFLFPLMQKLWKSIKKCKSYSRKATGLFFSRTQCISLYPHLLVFIHLECCSALQVHVLLCYFLNLLFFSFAVVQCTIHYFFDVISYHWWFFSELITKNFNNSQKRFQYRIIINIFDMLDKLAIAHRQAVNILNLQSECHLKPCWYHLVC